jgi:hypothetical protein
MNSAIPIPFYVAKGGLPLAGAANQMNFESLRNLDGTSKFASAPQISEIGGGWYKFAIAYGEAPFDSGDLVGVVDADSAGINGLSAAERYIPVEVRLDFYALSRLVNAMSQDKTTGTMTIKNPAGESILTLSISETSTSVDRNPQ